MTETAAPLDQLKKPFVFSISTKNETAFKIKQIATGVHFISLISLGFLYVLEHEYMFPCFVLAGISMALAIFIPPTGMIKPDDAPEYAKNSMNYMPDKDGPFGTGPFEQDPKKNKKNSKKLNKKKN
eukprot:CAMPEP_0196142346 /NCGR_PEP_ID=MMETSP0910-20130528/11556_1 /TAXON_ID=49265 /ORGANISM="Thalassiosira rotula, Strain GSO102" /LENGTH=125 /DNA_ID=CAMNT_0041403649 /DNA_START=124 /DNA_END=501 /DNA_ORIENTATION=+